MKHTITLTSVEHARAVLDRMWGWIEPRLQAGRRLELTIGDETRTTEQNRRQWPILQAFAQQVQWPVNGALVFMTDADWKDVLTAAYRREAVRVAQAFDGEGVVLLGQRTSKFTREQFDEWMAFLRYAAAERGVVIEPEEHA